MITASPSSPTSTGSAESTRNVGVDHSLGASIYRRPSHGSDVIPGPDQQRLNAPIPAEAEELPPVRLPTARDGIDDEDQGRGLLGEPRGSASSRSVDGSWFDAVAILGRLRWGLGRPRQWLRRPSG